MKVIQFVSLLLVVIGSFLPLVHIPIIGNWNYYKVDANLAYMVWGFSAIAFLGIVLKKTKLVRFSAIVLFLLFAFTIVAIKFKSVDYFSFLPSKSWQETFAGIVKLSWGWFLEFTGVLLLIFIKERK